MIGAVIFFSKFQRLLGQQQRALAVPLAIQFSNLGVLRLGSSRNAGRQQKPDQTEKQDDASFHGAHSC